jgi:molybdenum cofactor cytidylyltransferase
MARYFAIVPAAGHSRRMGQAKLLLPLAGQPLICHTLAAWLQSQASKVVVVVRADDNQLAAVAARAGAEVVAASPPPPDMKASIQAAMRHLDAMYCPQITDALLIAPADMPRLNAAIVNRLIAQHRAAAPHGAADRDAILAPTLSGKPGHPVLFPWRYAAEIDALRADEGLDAIVRRQPPRLIPCDDLITAGERPFADIDTPADYDRLTHEGDSPRPNTP